jgi:hypothetical protein
MQKTKTLRRIALGLFALALPIAVLMDVSEVASQTATTSPRLVSRAESTQLYTIHQGSPSTAVDTYHRLAALRDSEGLEKANESGTFVYLNLPADSKNQLIEVRLPVTKSAEARQGTLDAAARSHGLGTTDVKTIPASFAATTSKPAGVSDPTPYYNQLYSYVAGKGLASTDAPAERFAAVAAIPSHCAYADLATELSVPVGTVSAVRGSRRPASTEKEGRQ